MRTPVELQKELVSLDVNLKQLIQDVLACENQDSFAFKNREASETLQKMNAMIREVEILAEGTSKSSREEMTTLVETYRKVLHDNQVALRKANLTAENSLAARQRAELLYREERPGENGGVKRRGKMENEVLVRSSSNVTSNLISISRLMNDQVQSSTVAISQLEETSSLIVQSGEEAKTMGSVIHQSSKLLTKYDRRETTDKILIVFSFLFFFACCFYVFKKRAGIPFSWLWNWMF